MTSQWAVRAEGSFQPSDPTIQKIEPGCYRATRWGTLNQQALQTDKLLILDDAPTAGIIQNIRRFWKAQETFKLLGMMHKRGALVYGPPGAGKSAMVELICQDVVKDGGIVLLSPEDEEIRLMRVGINMVRAVEPSRPIVQLMEDIDSLIEEDEELLLSILDGENQVENIVYLATTNNIEKIPARIKNRPSRFDETVLVGMPSALARRAYLKSKMGSLLPEDTLSRWVADSEGFAIAHLRELMVGVAALQRPYEEVLARLRTMNSQEVVAPQSGTSASSVPEESGLFGAMYDN